MLVFLSFSNAFMPWTYVNPVTDVGISVLVWDLALESNIT